MADPFSIGVGALQIAEVASGVGCRIIRFIRDLKEVDVTTEDLFKKLHHLGHIVSKIEKLMKHQQSASPKSVDEEETETFGPMKSLLNSCDKDLEDFAKLLAPLKRNGGPKGAHRVITQARLDWNEKHIGRLEKRVHWNIMLLQTLSSCSEVVTQGDAMSRLAGNNDNMAQNLGKMQLDIEKLRSAFDIFSCGHVGRITTPSGTLTRVDSFNDANTEEAAFGRMKSALDLTESLCDRISTIGSVADGASLRTGTRRALSVVEAEEDYQFVHGHTEAADEVHTGTRLQVNEGDVTDRVELRDIISPVSDPNSNSLRQPMSSKALPRTVMDKMLEAYQHQATKDLEDSTPRYDDAERNLFHSLECGAKREQAHNVPFKERFDIGIKLAKAQLGQSKYTATEATLDSMEGLVGEDPEKRVRWTCTLAKLYQNWYSEAPDWRLLPKLQEFAIQAYNTAFQSMSSAPEQEQHLNDSASAMIAFFTWTGDIVGADTLRTMHPSVTVDARPIARQDLLGSPRPGALPVPSLSGGGSSVVSGGSAIERPGRRATTTGLDSGDLETPVEATNTLLLMAAKSKCVELVRYHIKRGDVNCRDSRQRTPLHLALLGPGGKDVAPVLLENGANVNARDVNGTSPLHICAELDKDEIAHDLVQKGAEVNAPDGAGETPLQIAVRKRRLRMVECLLGEGATVGDICKHSGSKEIDYVIQEHISNSAPSRTASTRRGFWGRG